MVVLTRTFEAEAELQGQLCVERVTGNPRPFVVTSLRAKLSSL